MFSHALRFACLAFLALCLPLTAAAEQIVEKAEMAGISGSRPFWDRPVLLTEEDASSSPKDASSWSKDGATRMADHGRMGRGLVADWSTDKPGAPVFDAIHRGLLVRFPDAAAKIAAEIGKGRKIQKAELVFDFVDTEYYPMEYILPAGMSFLGDLWVRIPPRWHAVAWALRRPWKADAKLGPTYNANVNGISYWTRFGARNEQDDRHPRQFGPTEVSYKITEGRMDVTPALTDPAFGKTLGERLRAVADQGFIVRKWEAYDARYMPGGYEYGGATGGRGIRVKPPRLVVTLVPGEMKLGALPPAVDIAKVPPSGKPTAVVPSDARIRAFIERYKLRQPATMPDWQWTRVNELLDLAYGKKGGFPDSVEAYTKWIDHLNSLPYRQFRGHHTPLTTHDYILYSAAMPEAIREHMRRYWAGWLMPGRGYHELEHNQWHIWTKPENGYYARTGDWRGNHSFYRESYTRFMSTMNFNHMAAAAALFGGRIIGDPESIADGRYGLEHFLLRLWSWYDGTTQESIDHYYLGLTLLNQKAFVDLSPTKLDRMMGESILSKAIGELAGCYHPALRRFIATSGRTGIAYLLVVNEGPGFIMHVLSRKGALHDVNNPDRMGMPVAGHELPPEIVARQELIGPWAPAWISNIIDEKPLPFELTATFKQWGAHRKEPLWKRSYLGHDYGLATLDVAVGNQTVPVMAQWRHADKPALNVQDIGTLLMRYGINTTEFYDSLYHGTTHSNANGSVGTQGGHTAALQYRNKAIVLTSPFRELQYPGGRPIPKDVHSLQSSIALANYQKNPVWKIYVDGKPLGALPFKARQSSRITLHDGVSYVGIIPVPATDLGRTEEVLITDGGKPVAMQGGGNAAPSLVINSYNFYNANAPLDRKTADWTQIDRAYGGFVIELSDRTEYPSFAAFQKHIDAVQLKLRWDDAAGVLHVDCQSGPDRLELGYRPEYEGSWNRQVPSDRCFPYRRVNGAWPYLPPGLERDTTLSQQGRTGRLEKNQAVLTFQPGRMGYLLTEPISGNCVFSNPLPDPQYMVMDLPGGMRIKADGRLGLMRLTANPRAGTIDVDYALKEGQTGPDMADALLVFGAAKMPKATLNGRPCGPLRQVALDRTTAWVLPLSQANPTPAQIARKYELAALPQLTALSALSKVDAVMRYESGEHYLLTEPRGGAFAFTRLWPGESVIEATAPGGVTVATDGRIALQRLTVSPRESRIEIDYAPYLQRKKSGGPIDNRATALLVFGMDKAPSANLHGKEYTGKVESVRIDGKQAWIIPLFGDDPDEVKKGIAGRYAKAMSALAKVYSGRRE